MADEWSIPKGLNALYRRFDVEPQLPGGAPVFLLASAWRSGSTLMQRLLVSGGDLMMWGEPYDHSALIRSMAESVIPFDDKWPPANYIVDPADPPTAEKWIANAYPHPSDLMAAHRAFFDRLFDVPAQELGFARWGVKGVRLSGEHAVYLRRIYPDARFIFLYRNPYDAFLSYRLLHDIRTHSYWWYHRWPDDQVADAAHFGRLWRSMTSSYLEWGPQLGAVTVAYEDVVRGKDLDRVAKLVGMDLSSDVLDRKVGATGDQRGEWEGARRNLDGVELSALRETAGGLARRARHDSEESRKSFMEKRPPKYLGR